MGGGGTTVKIPQTNYTKEQTQTLAGLTATAPGYFALNSAFAKPYTDLNLRTLQETLFGSPGTTGELPLQSAAYGFTRASDINDVLNLGPVGYAALFRSNPGLAMTLLNANRQGAETFAPGNLMDTLQNTAKGQLSLGGYMSPQELGMIDQGYRSGQASRGIVGTTPSLAGELLNRDSAFNNRLGQRINWAQGVEGTALSDRNYLNSLASLNAGVYNPFQDVLGRSVLGGGISPLSLMGTADTTRLFNPAAGNDAFNTNYNAQASAKIANANNAAAQNSGLIQGGASLLGSLALGALMFSDERLKKKVRTLGKSASGIPIKRFEYKDGSGRQFIGTTAKDVAHVPGAVVRTRTGHAMVDYSKLDVPFFELFAEAKAA